jgi:hypothetical protein
MKLNVRAEQYFTVIRKLKWQEIGKKWKCENTNTIHIKPL